MAKESSTYKSIGGRIKAFRERAGMSQIELAEALGFQSATAISFIESGDRKVSVEGLNKVASILHTSVQALLGDPVQQPDIRTVLRADKHLTRDDEGKIIGYIEFIKSRKRGK